MAFFLKILNWDGHSFTHRGYYHRLFLEALDMHICPKNNLPTQPLQCLPYTEALLVLWRHSGVCSILSCQVFTLSDFKPSYVAQFTAPKQGSYCYVSSGSLCRRLSLPSSRPAEFDHLCLQCRSHRSWAVKSSNVQQQLVWVHKPSSLPLH